METITQILTTMPAIALIGFVGIFAIALIMLPFSAYSAQKWAYRSCMELKHINDQLNGIRHDINKPMKVARPPPPAKPPAKFAQSEDPLPELRRRRRTCC